MMKVSPRLSSGVTPPLRGNRMNDARSIRTRLLVPIAATLGASAALLVFGWVAELWFISPGRALVWHGWLTVDDPEVARAIVIQVLEVLAGVFAISITVVAIIVQLSATRYTSRVVDLFLADPFNGLVMFSYVMPLLYGFWLAIAITPESYSHVSVAIFNGLTTLSIVLLIPYFLYLFYFLQPSSIINKIERSIEQTLGKVRSRPGYYERGRHEVNNSLQQLSDISLSSIARSDIALALQSLNSMRDIAIFYLQLKNRLDERWFNVDSGQIMGLSEEMRTEIVRSRTWLEMEIFKHYEIAFTSSLRRVRDINSCVAMNLREIGAVAATTDDDQTLEFIIKGFNTLVMYTLSERDIRSAVHVFYQYRILAESILYRPEMVEKIAEHFKYYGQNSQRRRIFFIMDAVAYDLRVLIELAFGNFPETVERLLKIFLELDQIAQTETDIAFLKGVRKSQAMLGGFFIRHHQPELARRVLADVETEDKEFLWTIKKELFGVTSKEFWEIEDRGVSFFYVAEEERESMEIFFSWLLGENEPRGRSIAGG
jgi:hypothetical protein